ncbi:MAG: amidohydrolase [Clostridia bacterium]|nr:amidohydrolase [Clostridia bacterium]
MAGEIIENGFVCVENGKIADVGSMENAPEGERFNANGGILLPGLIDAHTHIGLFNEGMRFEGEDGNEDTDPITPHLRALDGIYPQDIAFNEAALAGVTTVVTGPGSANPIGGTFAAIKTRGVCVDDMAINPSAAMKFAFGENPKISYNSKERSPVTRMATAALIRETLFKAQEYADSRLDEEDCDFDMKLEAILPLLDGELIAQMHAHRADDIFTAIRISREFDIDMALVHATEGHLIAEKIAEAKVPVICGPMLNSRSKPELAHQTVKNAAILAKAGVKCALCTDHPEVPQNYLMLSAALAAAEGVGEYEALAMITINAAEIAGIETRVGSIEVGKDADFVLYAGHPFDTRSKVSGVWIDGERIV